ncbi:ARM repeat-containing protein [Massarina eburnea CBS 473.64]|uniref:ARM repeat-containing protein n=1 Tax=Massarina eburnea CBS 473.64 TaxID=1395130 RepID=A0A6A6RTU3_9PLEO|nr:ARM repeat-containing protein [Massarina eburnea CBS 473.64]
MAANPAGAGQGLPMNLGEIEKLVKTLYDPGHAKKVAETEATLRVLQRSPQGWEIGDALLNNADENVRFFGALTLTVKLNADSAGLSEEDGEQLLAKLIHHLVTHPKKSASQRKLCSTLAQFFTKPISTWSNCIRSLAVSFVLQQPVLDDTLDSHPSVWDIIPQLPDEQLHVLLDFAINLADETKKLSNSPNRKPHQRMIANVESIEVLLQVALGRGIEFISTPPNDPDHNRGELLCVAALECYLGWVFYAHSEFKEVPEKLRYLRSCTELALTCLEYHVDFAMDFVAEILEGYPKFFQDKHYQMLWSAITSQWGLDILKSCDAEAVGLARIIVAYASELVESNKAYREPENAHYQHVFSICHHLLQYTGYVGVEDEVALIVLDFWSNYVTTVAEELIMCEEQPAWKAPAQSHVFQAVAELLQKIIYPPKEVTNDWDSDEKKTFKVFRMDVRDIIMEAFELLRNGLTEQFINFAVHALEGNRWLELEAALFSLISIADGLTNVDEKLVVLFERPLFATISEHADIPAITRRTTVELVASLNHFFLRNPQFLPQVLPFLLNALAQPSLANGAAKSFASLCSECRKSLTGELASFFQMYEQFLTYQTAEEHTKSKVLEGIAAIVQAEDTEEKQLAGVQQIFRYVANDAMQAVSFAKEANDLELAQVYAMSTLKCLSSIGKALQASDDDVVDLSGTKEESQFWTQGPGKEIQNQLINFINYMTQIFPANDEIIESACNILRVGFKEMGSGPFALPPAASIDYITSTNVQTPRLTYVLETACCWVSSHKSSPDFELQAQRLLRYDLGIMQALQHPRNDPEISVGCVELIQSFLKQNATILMNEHPDVLKGTFDFSIECIKSPEVLPKRAAASLWKDIFEKTSSTGSQDQATCQDIVDHFGQAVAFALVSNICGEVDASSLDNILAPLRKLILNQRLSRQYITNALAEMPILQGVQGDQGWQDAIRKFIESAMRNAKTSAAFKEAVKTFWQSCKQLHMQFAPQMMHHAHRFNY